jgi:hypothetical protein
MGAITILCLPISTSRKLEIGFKMIEKLPDDTLKMIIKRYVEEGKKSDVSFDNMIDPMVRILGFERLWKILDAETIRLHYGEWALAKWQDMAKSHHCEGAT